MKYHIILRKLPLLLLALLVSSCSMMSQSKNPIANRSADNELSTTVDIIPISAQTLLDIRSSRSQKTPATNPPPLDQKWDYRIGAGDVLSIVVWDHPQLTIPAGPQRTPQEAGNWVSPNGTIFYPYIGILFVAGKTISEVREAVTSGLKSVIPNPQVDVSVARFSSQQVHITGAVSSPGSISVTNLPFTVMDAIDKRDGALPNADLQRIKLVRNNTNYNINLKSFLDSGNAIDNPQLLSGDVVVVPLIEYNEVYVMGEVKEPGTIPLTDTPLSLTAALADREGINKATANARGVFVFRHAGPDNHINVYQLDISNPTALLLGTRFLLDKGDVVYATSAPATRWNRIISNLIPSLGIVNTLLLLDDRT